jgi:P63C domain-containing protein
LSEKDAASKAAKALSKRGAAKGGRARASVLTGEEKREIAQNAARKRWEKERERKGEAPAPPPPALPSAGEVAPAGDDLPFSAFPGTLMMGDLELECHVLNDGRRVLTAREVVRALRGTRSNPPGIQRYFDALPEYSEGMFDDRMMQFRIPGLPQVASGFEATVLIDMCDLYIAADENGVLRSNQGGLVAQSWAIMRSCSKVGIEALIDEATGYQEVRAKRALQVKLQAFIADEMQDWVKTFPDEFWEELARLEGIRYQARHRPLRWGNYVMKFIYNAIDPDVAAELKRRNPNPSKGKNLHQLLRDHGKDKLHQQLGGVIAIMRECKDMNEFRSRFDRVFAKRNQFEFDLDLAA